MADQPDAKLERPWAVWIAFAGFVAVAGYFLWAEHRAHVASAIPYLPYVLLLACPLLHVFLHRGHSHKRHRHGRDGE